LAKRKDDKSHEDDQGDKRRQPMRHSPYLCLGRPDWRLSSSTFAVHCIRNGTDTRRQTHRGACRGGGVDASKCLTG
jgi:hypothetical protein